MISRTCATCTKVLYRGLNILSEVFVNLLTGVVKIGAALEDGWSGFEDSNERG